MRRILAYILIVAAVVLAWSGIVLAQGGTADDGDDPVEIREQTYEYIGTRDCRDCHRDNNTAHRDTPHALTLVELEADMAPEDNPVVADFSVGEDLRTVTFEDDSTRAFTLEDVAYTLGAGVNVQAYLYEGEDGFYVFPVEWVVADGEWKPLDLGGDWPSEAYAFGPNCAGCHTTDLNVETYEWSEDGVMCETCHGPGLDHVEAADDAGGSIDDAERAEIYALINLGLDSQTCGQCHARGLSADGIHPYPTDYFPGQDLTAAFDLADSTDEAFFYSSGHAFLPNMQYNEHLMSSHPMALGDMEENVEDYDAECLVCHSVAEQRLAMLLANEDIDPETVTVEGVVSEFAHGVTCASCHSPHMELEEGEERLAAGLRMEADAMCVSCHMDTDVTEGLHVATMEVFQGVSLVEAVEAVPSAHFEAEDGPTCTTCHMPAIDTFNGERNSHTFNIVSPGDALDIEALDDSCSICHTETPASLQDLIDDIQADTRTRVEMARAAITDDTPEWVTRALDAVEGDGSAGIHNYQYTDNLLDAVEVELNLLEGEA